MLVNGQPKLYTNECANDLWIRELVFPGKRGGYFVEAGAANGVSSSSCFFLERHMEWRGLCIEPHDEFFADLVHFRPNSVHENVCLASEAGWVEFAQPSARDGVSPFRSGVRRVLEESKWEGAEVVAKAALVRKPAAALADLLRKHHAPWVIDYGAFDIEGSEYEALRAFPFGEYRFLALSFELDPRAEVLLAKLLGSNGYRKTSNPLNRNCPWEHYWLHESVPG